MNTKFLSHEENVEYLKEEINNLISSGYTEEECVELIGKGLDQARLAGQIYEYGLCPIHAGVNDGLYQLQIHPIHGNPIHIMCKLGHVVQHSGNQPYKQKYPELQGTQIEMFED